MLLHNNLIADGHAHAGSFANRFCGEKQVKYSAFEHLQACLNHYQQSQLLSMRIQ